MTHEKDKEKPKYIVPDSQTDELDDTLLKQETVKKKQIKTHCVYMKLALRDIPNIARKMPNSAGTNHKTLKKKKGQNTHPPNRKKKKWYRIEMTKKKT